MKKMIALGLGIVSLVLAVVLRPTGPNPVVEAKRASIESQQTSKTAHVRHGAIRQTQTVYAGLLAAVEAEADPDRRSQTLELVVGSVSHVDLPVVLDSLAQAVSPGAAELRQLLVRRWAESDAPAVAQWTSQLPEGSVRRAALEQVAIAWANRDLPAAAGWVSALNEGDSKQAATLGLAYEAARTEPVAALELASTLAPTRERDDLLVHAVSQWVAVDPAAAVVWVLEIPPSPARERVIASVAVAWAEEDGSSAATLAAQALRLGNEQDRTAVAIVQRWAQNSPNVASAWVSEFPDTTTRDTAVQHLLALWTVHEAKAAGNWLHGLPAGSLRDVGMATYSQALVERDRVGAVARQDTFSPGPM